MAEHYGQILATARRQKWAGKATDLLIVATAAATGRVALDNAQAQLAHAVGIPCPTIRALTQQ